MYDLAHDNTPKTFCFTVAVFDLGLTKFVQVLLVLHSFTKETFLRMPFFWRRVYASETGVIHHFDNAHKDPMSGSVTQGHQEKWTD